jgi:membrane-bound serine protease (ClpP class)
MGKAMRMVRLAVALSGALLGVAATEARQSPTAVPAWRQATRIAVIPVSGEIDGVTRASAERRIAEAAAAGCGVAVLELDTPGGDLNATLELCLWIKDRAPVPVWAWVRPKAYSAGAIIALACRGILVSPGSAFGDAAPIMAIPGLGLQPLPPAERAKIEAPVLSEVVDSARRNGYDETLVRAFVSAPDEVWMLERDDGSARAFVGRQEYAEAFGAEPPTSRAGAAPRTAIAPGAPAIPFVDLSMRRPGDDGPTNEAERDRMVEDQQVRPPVRQRIRAEDAGSWRLVTQVDGADELLVTYAPEAIAAGLAQSTVADERELMAWFGATTVSRVDEHWGDALVRFLTSWPVRLALVAVLVCGFVVELAVPGVGWFGAAATAALVLLLGGPAMGGVTAWWPLLLVVLGAALVVVEVFVIPGFGLIGIVGIGCALVGLVGGFVDAPLNTPGGRSDLAAAIGVVSGGAILAAGGAWLATRLLPRTAAARAVVLEATVGGTAPPARDRLRPVAVGEVGIAVTPLRPVGKAEFGGVIREVNAVGAMVESGARVVVVRASDYAVEVEACPPCN